MSSADIEAMRASLVRQTCSCSASAKGCPSEGELVTDAEEAICEPPPGWFVVPYDAERDAESGFYLFCSGACARQALEESSLAEKTIVSARCACAWDDCAKEGLLRRDESGLFVAPPDGWFLFTAWINEDGVTEGPRRGEIYVFCSERCLLEALAESA